MQNAKWPQVTTEGALAAACPGARSPAESGSTAATEAGGTDFGGCRRCPWDVQRGALEAEQERRPLLRMS